mmetsp:Transcript_10810/g.23109  ORF Transcript_10810/g.23109 Transcript_10810/m.23109 type:complete len:220 (-) Transcript_10810:9-668(-)
MGCDGSPQREEMVQTLHRRRSQCRGFLLRRRRRQQPRRQRVPVLRTRRRRTRPPQTPIRNLRIATQPHRFHRHHLGIVHRGSNRNVLLPIRPRPPAVLLPPPRLPAPLLDHAPRPSFRRSLRTPPVRRASERRRRRTRHSRRRRLPMRPRRRIPHPPGNPRRRPRSRPRHRPILSRIRPLRRSPPRQSLPGSASLSRRRGGIPTLLVSPGENGGAVSLL